MNKKKILITGALGYVGKNLIYHLNKKKKFNLILTDKINLPNIEFLKKNKFIKLNLNIKNILRLLKKVKPDLIVHLAALTSVTESETQKKKYLEINFQLTKKIVDYCKNNNTKLIFSSSAAVYKSKNTPIKEKSKKEPKNFYGKTKLLSENYIKNSLCEESNYIILRFFNIAGGEVKKKLIFSKKNYPVTKILIKNLLDNKKFTIYGKGKTNNKSSIRDYIHVKDISEIIDKSINHLCNGKKNLIINCCTGIPTTISYLIMKLKIISKKSLNFSFQQLRKGEDLVFYGDNTKLKQELNHTNKYNIHNIMKDTYDCLR